jgi:hypothetical protein
MRFAEKFGFQIVGEEYSRFQIGILKKGGAAISSIYPMSTQNRELPCCHLKIRRGRFYKAYPSVVLFFYRIGFSFYKICAIIITNKCSIKIIIQEVVYGK